MTPEGWVLRAARDIPASKRTLEALAEHHGASDGKLTVKALILYGRLEKVGSTRKARYRVPVDNLKKFREGGDDDG